MYIHLCGKISPFTVHLQSIWCPYSVHMWTSNKHPLQGIPCISIYETKLILLPSSRSPFGVHTVSTRGRPLDIQKRCPDVYPFLRQYGPKLDAWTQKGHPLYIPWTYQYPVMYIQRPSSGRPCVTWEETLIKPIIRKICWTLLIKWVC